MPFRFALFAILAIFLLSWLPFNTLPSLFKKKYSAHSSELLSNRLTRIGIKDSIGLLIEIYRLTGDSYPHGMKVREAFSQIRTKTALEHVSKFLESKIEEVEQGTEGIAY
jgi:hypothetical protein